MLIHTLLPASLLLLFGALLALWVVLYQKPDEVLERLSRRLGWLTFVVYALWLALLTFEQRQIPILTVGQVSAFLGFLIWMDQLLVQRRIPQRILVVLPLGVVIVLLLGGMAGGFRHTDSPAQLQSAWSAVHIALSMSGIAMLFGGGVYGAGLLLLRRELVNRKFGRLFSSLPSLDELHKLRAVALYAGWLLITLSLASSVVFMFFANSGTPSFFSHLHEMFGLWAVTSVLVLSERMRWLGDHSQARLTVGLTALMFAIVAGSVLQIFLGGKL